MAEEPKKGRLTLYEDLLSAETLANIKAKDAAVQAEEAKKKSNASLKFKPTNLGKKPTATKTQQAKPKPSFSAMHKLPSSTSTSTIISAPPTIYPKTSSPESHSPQLSSTPAHPSSQSLDRQGQKRGFNDWLADEDEEWQYYDRTKVERGGKKKRKNKNKQGQEQIWSWDDIYDPTVPVNFLEYPRSDAQYDTNDAWKRRLYTARRREMRRQGQTAGSGRSVDDKNGRSSHMNFGPPDGLNFAPPAEYNTDAKPPSHFRDQSPRQNTDDLARTLGDPPEKKTAPNTFVRRIAVSPPPEPEEPSPMEPPPPIEFISSKSPPIQKPTNTDAAEKAAKAAAQIAALKAKIAASKPAPSTGPTVQSQSQIQNPVLPSVAPDHAASPPLPPPPPTVQAVEHTHVPLPAPGAPGTMFAAPTFNPEYFSRKEKGLDDEMVELDETAEDSDQPRSNRPGQAGFAERMLKKMGWEKGQGLGKTGDGITTAIFAKAEKRKKLPDSAGGGFAAPANMGKIVGGKKKATKASQDNTTEGDAIFGNMSDVIKLEGMLKGMDVDLEIQDNNLLQEIGEEMGQFGTVERLFIWREHAGGTNDVFVKFTSQLSALRAVKAMDEEVFEENVIKARFWDAEKFEKEDYA